MERFPNIERIFSKDRLRGGLDSFFLHIAQINDANLRKNIVDSIMQKVEQDEYFSEDEFVGLIENLLNQNNLQNKLNQILPEAEGKRTLHGLLRKNFEGYFRSSPEKKGINFRDRLDTPEYVRAFLYITLPENQKAPFKSDFEKLLTQKEEFYFRLWPPKFRDYFKDFITLYKKKVRPGEFPRELLDHIKSLQLGKDRITLYFSEDLLPDELKGKSEDELRQLGVVKEGNRYEIYLTPDKIEEILYTLAERGFSVAEQQTEIGKKLASIKELFKEARKNSKSLPGGKYILAPFASFIVGLEDRYRDALKEGMSEEEAKKLLEAINRLEGILKEIAESSKDEKKKKNVWAKAKDWLKKNGGVILSSIGLWGLAIGWFLPLWLITKMYEPIERGALGGRAKAA